MKNPSPEITKTDVEGLIDSAKKVLDENWTGSYTLPSASQYPHQWSWDSVFIAMGYVHYDQNRAESELRHLLDGQWENGMIPHIIFNSNEGTGEYFPGPDFWKTEKSEYSPDEIATSGICQPPVHATGLLHLIDHAPDKERALQFAEELFPKITAWHDYLYRERDPFDEGLVYIRHPWESGQDNSPIWDTLIQNIEVDKSALPAYHRKDDLHVNAEERPTNDEYDTYVYLVDFFRKRMYNEKKIWADNCPFLVQDVLFNSLLCKSNRDLGKIAERLDKPANSFYQQADETAKSMNEKLWDDPEQMYVDFDLIMEKKIQARVLSGFLPLFAGIPDKHQKQKMFEYLNTHCFCQLTDTCFPAPSYDRSGEGYSSRKYWRGPVWINMNWLLAEGLKRYGYKGYVKQLNESIIQLPFISGFREYYDTENGKGYGTDGFSWTASLLLDIIYRNKITELE